MQQGTLLLAPASSELAHDKPVCQARLFETIRPDTLSLREKTAIFELARQLAVQNYEDQFVGGAVQAGRICVDYLRGATEERFAVIFLSTQNQVIRIRQYGTGTINQCAVFPREIAKDLLMLNAAAVILTHNHPSGMVEPSSADKNITGMIVDALALFDGRVLDHFIVSGDKTFSFAEHGLL